MVFNFGIFLFINCLLCNLKLSLSIMYVFINLRGFFLFCRVYVGDSIGYCGRYFCVLFDRGRDSI